ncbi:MAG TPA: hypothetical protein VIF10_02765 [Methylobacter sp.]|jgi:hypothetical protein
MFTHGFKWHFIHVFLAVLCLASTASYGQGEGNGAPPPTPSTLQTDTHPPPVEQALVPESVFAMQLVDALKLGPVPDEAKAEERLSGLGIEPKNGWIADYPVTPAVLGDIEKSIAEASDQGKIAFTKDQALKLVGEVKAGLGLAVSSAPNVPPGVIKSPGHTTLYIYTDRKGVVHYTDNFDAIPKEYRGLARVISQPKPHELSGEAESGTTEALEPQYNANLPPEDINNYYDEQGPPVVTYYSPPDPYAYLYAWVPYPFWSTGFYFPGFFVLNNFHRHVLFNRHSFFVSHHVGRGAPFSQPLSIGPTQHALPGPLMSDRMAPSRWFSSPHAEAGARAIIMLNQNHNRLINGSAISRRDASRQPFSSAGHAGTRGNVPAVQNGRVMMPHDHFRSTPASGIRIFTSPRFNPETDVPNAPRFSSRSGIRVFTSPRFNPRTDVPNTPRFSSRPAFDHARVFSSPRSFGAGGSGRFPMGGGSPGFHGGGNFARHGGFAGGSRGGHR